MGPALTAPGAAGAFLDAVGATNPALDASFPWLLPNGAACGARAAAPAAAPAAGPEGAAPAGLLMAGGGRCSLHAMRSHCPGKTLRWQACG